MTCWSGQQERWDDEHGQPLPKNGSLMQRGSFTQSMMLVRAVSRFGKKSSEACIAQSQLIAAKSLCFAVQG